MPPKLHLSFLLFLLPITNAIFLYDYPTASPNTTWINNPLLTPNRAFFFDGSSIRILLLDGAGGPTFACGFICYSPCNGFLFSIFVVNTTTFSELLINLNDSPPSVWSANRDHLVGENATLHFTKDGDLILRDADGSFVWSTNTANRSVSAMSLTHSGNLLILDSKNDSVWSSFDNPTDTLLDSQTLKQGQRLTAQAQFYLSLQSQGLHFYINSDTPQLYLKVKMKPEATNLSFKNGRLEWGNNNSHSLITNPMNWAVLFLRLDLDGHLRVYGIGQNSIPGATILSDYTNSYLDYCDYPMACGKYGVCSNGQCTCPVLNGDSSFFHPITWGELNPGCSPSNPISCEFNNSHLLLALGNISYFSYADENAAAIRGIEEEKCKEECLMNCSCKAAFFKQGRESGLGDCYLPTDIFSLNNGSSNSYRSSAYMKLQMTSATDEEVPPEPVASSSCCRKEEDGAKFWVLAAIFGSLLLVWGDVFNIVLITPTALSSVGTGE